MNIVTKLFSGIYTDILLIALVLGYIAYGWEGSTAQVVGILIALISLPFWLKARLDLGESFSRRPEAKKLVTKGLYTKIRNPMYIFGGLVILGLIIAINSMYGYLFLLLLLCMQIIRAKKENAVLSKRFGKEYLDYKNQTWF